METIAAWRDRLERTVLAVLTRRLKEKGAAVLRAPVAAGNEHSLARFRAAGYEPVQIVFQRALEEG